MPNFLKISSKSNLANTLPLLYCPGTIKQTFLLANAPPSTIQRAVYKLLSYKVFASVMCFHTGNTHNKISIYLFISISIPVSRAMSISIYKSELSNHEEHYQHKCTICPLQEKNNPVAYLWVQIEVRRTTITYTEIKLTVYVISNHMLTLFRIMQWKTPFPLLLWAIKQTMKSKPLHMLMTITVKTIIKEQYILTFST